jgi:hypothetical protein
LSYAQLMQHAEEIRHKAIEKYADDAKGGSDSPLYDQAKAYATKIFADIPQVFQPYTEIPKPESFDPMINAMGSVLDKLSTGEVADDPVKHVSYPANVNLTKVPGVTDAIEDWTGEAARSFKRFFVDPFPAIAKNQFLVARVVGAALDSEKDLWARAQKNIDEIAHKTLEALDKMHDCGKNDWNVAFTVAGALAALAGVVATGGADLPFAIAEFTATTGGAAVSTYSGETADTVIHSMRQSISDLTDKINETEYRIWKAADATRSAVQQDRKRYVSDRPELADANAGNVKNPKYMGHAS